jgi:predicted ATP-grasp superfamily ATP-dependent carboligase
MPGASPVDVLVTDAGGNHALAVIRSLGRRGLRVAAAGDRFTSMGLYSRYCARRAVLPDPRFGVGEFRDGLLRLLERLRPGLLMPMTERTLLAIDVDREAIETRVPLAPLPPPPALETVFDKRATLDLAESLGIPAPRTFAPASAAGLAALRPRLTWPAVVKPRRSERLLGAGDAGAGHAGAGGAAGGGAWGGGAAAAVVAAGGPAAYCHRPEDLEATHAAVHRRAPWPLVQEFIPGDGYGVSALCRHGRVLALFAHRRLRMLRPTGSGSTLRESIPPPPDMEAAARLLLEALRWHGVAMVEFKRDRRDGAPVLMEINGRFWNSLPLAVAAGVDFPWLLYRLAADGDCPEQRTYRAGVRCRWLLGDARHLLAVLRGRPAGWREEFPTRGRAIRDVLRSGGPGTHCDDLWAGDPLPFVAEIGDALLAGAGGVARAALPRLRPRRPPAAPAPAGPEGA